MSPLFAKWEASLAKLDEELKTRKPETLEEREARYLTLSDKRPPRKGCRCIEVSPREGARYHDEQLDARASGKLKSAVESLCNAADAYAFESVFNGLRSDGGKL